MDRINWGRGTDTERSDTTAQLSGAICSSAAQVAAAPKAGQLEAALVPHLGEGILVEEYADRLAIEQATGYRGLYFVLQGRLSPLDGIGPRELGLDRLGAPPGATERLRATLTHERLGALQPVAASNR